MQNNSSWLCLCVHTLQFEKKINFFKKRTKNKNKQQTTQVKIIMSWNNEKQLLVQLF
jgi:hypothetical protein